MTKLYSDADLWDAHRQRSRILGGFYAVTGVYLAAFVALFVYFVMLPYDDPNQDWVIAVECVLTALYIIFLFPYMGISFKRCNAYFKMLKFISVGLKEYSVAPFTGIDDWTTRDGVDVNVALFKVHNYKRDEDMIRQIYVDGEKDFPPIEEGQRVRFISQGNLLIEYEIIKENEQCGQS